MEHLITMMIIKKLTKEFKIWKWFIPAFGLFYLLWYGVITIKKYDSDINKVYDKSLGFIIFFYLYMLVHIYGMAFFVAWMLSLLGII